jgi:hypothetical protein
LVAANPSLKLRANSAHLRRHAPVISVRALSSPT